MSVKTCHNCKLVDMNLSNPGIKNKYQCFYATHENAVSPTHRIKTARKCLRMRFEESMMGTFRLFALLSESWEQEMFFDAL